MVEGVEGGVEMREGIVREFRIRGFPCGSDSKESACTAGDLGSMLGSERSPGEGNGNPLQILAFRIPWTEEPGRLQSTGSRRVGHS